MPNGCFEARRTRERCSPKAPSSLPSNPTASGRGRGGACSMSRFPPPLRQARADAFADLDQAEYQRRDPSLSAELASELTGSADPAIRATALIRLARALRARGQHDAALPPYEQAAKTHDAAIEGVPADLFARWAACALLADLKRDAELQIQSQALNDDLVSGRWTLAQPVYEMHLADSVAWTRSVPAVKPTSDQLLLTGAVEILFTRLQRTASNPRGPQARQVLDVNGTPVTVLAAFDENRTVALVASTAYVDREWLSKTTLIARPQGLSVAVLRPASRGIERHTTVRAACQTRLHRAVAINVLDADAERAGLRQRQSLWVAGLIVLTLLLRAERHVDCCKSRQPRAGSGATAIGLRRSSVPRVRSPLTTMTQTTEMLIDERITDEAGRRRHLLALGRQTERLRRLVESLLDFGRIEAGASPYRPPPPGCAGVGCGRRRAVPAGLRKSWASRSCPAAAGRAFILGDRDALTHALWNVLDNAVKYSPDAADVWVDVHRSRERIAIEVRDAGLGIPREEQRDVFGRFVRGTRAKADNISGTGIGLAIVRHVVTAHDGDVTLRSAPGEGSTFTLIFPATSEESTQCLAS